MVAGGNGYIGSHLSSHLYELGHQVLVFDRDGSKNAFAEVVTGDLEDRKHLAATLRGFKPHGLFHLGSPSVVGESFEAPSLYARAIDEVTNSVVSACADTGTKNLIFSSSCSVYGDANEADETFEIRPQSPYAQSKVLAESTILSAAREGNFKAGVLRFFNVIGCDTTKGLRERHEPETHVLPLLVRCSMTGEKFNLFGDSFDTEDGTAVRDYVDVRDVTSGLYLGMQKVLDENAGFYRIWNLGSNSPVSIRDLIRAVEQVTGKPINLHLNIKRIGDPGAVSAKNQRAKRELGWQPKLELADSVRSVADALNQTLKEKR